MRCPGLALPALGRRRDRIQRLAAAELEAHGHHAAATEPQRRHVARAVEAGNQFGIAAPASTARRGVLWSSGNATVGAMRRNSWSGPGTVGRGNRHHLLLSKIRSKPHPASLRVCSNGQPSAAARNTARAVGRATYRAARSRKAAGPCRRRCTEAGDAGSQPMLRDICEIGELRRALSFVRNRPPPGRPCTAVGSDRWGWPEFGAVRSPSGSWRNQSGCSAASLPSLAACGRIRSVMTLRPARAALSAKWPTSWAAGPSSAPRTFGCKSRGSATA